MKTQFFSLKTFFILLILIAVGTSLLHHLIFATYASWPWWQAPGANRVDQAMSLPEVLNRRDKQLDILLLGASTLTQSIDLEQLQKRDLDVQWAEISAALCTEYLIYLDWMFGATDDDRLPKNIYMWIHDFAFQDADAPSVVYQDTTISFEPLSRVVADRHLPTMPLLSLSDHGFGIRQKYHMVLDALFPLKKNAFNIKRALTFAAGVPLFQYVDVPEVRPLYTPGEHMDEDDLDKSEKIWFQIYQPSRYSDSNIQIEALKKIYALCQSRGIYFILVRGAEGSILREAAQPIRKKVTPLIYQYSDDVLDLCDVVPDSGIFDSIHTNAKGRQIVTNIVQEYLLTKP